MCRYDDLYYRESIGVYRAPTVPASLRLRPVDIPAGETGITMANPITGGDILLTGCWKKILDDFDGRIIGRVGPLAGTPLENWSWTWFPTSRESGESSPYRSVSSFEPSGCHFQTLPS
jgi:hypothetical protein